jgi:MFS transporter, DHA2 family, methylenomycin A resistance protein
MNKDRQRITLLATSISYVLVILDTSIVNVALEDNLKGSCGGR